MLRRSTRLLLVVAAVVGFFAATVTPAAATPTVTVAVAVFSAPATVDAQIYAPVSPLNPVCGVGNCPARTTTYSFSTALATSACVGAYLTEDLGGPSGAIGVGVTLDGQPVAAGMACALSSEGTVTYALSQVTTETAGVGAWCGLSSGSGTTSATVGGVVSAPATMTPDVNWYVSAGTVLPLVFSGDANGVGAVQTTGPTPGPCGLGYVPVVNENEAGADRFQVTGFALLSQVTL